MDMKKSILIYGPEGNHGIGIIMREYKKFSRHKITLFSYRGKKEDIEKLKKMQGDILFTVHTEQIKELRDKFVCYYFLAGVYKNRPKGYYTNLNVPLIVHSLYGYNSFEKITGAKCILLKAGVNTQRFKLREGRVERRKPIFAMAYNPMMSHRKGTGVISKLNSIGCNAINLTSIDYEKMPLAYQSIDCLIINSPDDGRDVCHMPGLEAGSCGIPVITTPVGIASEIIKDDLGYIVNNEEQIIEICKKHKDNSELIEIGKKYAKVVRSEYCWEKRVEDWDNFFDNARE